MNRLTRTCVLSLFVSYAALAFAQQTDDTQGTQPTDNAAMLAEVQQLKADVERLSQEVERLDNEVQRLQTARPAAVSTARTKPTRTSVAQTAAPVVTEPTPAPQPEEATPVTILVFRDGHRIETRNYAIIGENIWINSEQESKKYPVADLDVDGTKKVNSDRGVLFQLPPAR